MSIARVEITKQFHLQIVRRREVAVSTLGGKYVMPGAVPIEAALTEAGSGGDQCLIARGARNLV